MKKVWRFIWLFLAGATLTQSCITPSASEQDRTIETSTRTWQGIVPQVDRSDPATPLPFALKALPTLALSSPRVVKAADRTLPLLRATHQVALPERTVDLNITVQRIHSRTSAMKPSPQVPAKEPGIRETNPACISCFSKLQGLRHDVVHDILQDRSGHLWFATGGGASRYDGRSFTHFGEPESIPMRTVWSMLEDRAGRIWLGGSEGGLCFIDGHSITVLEDSAGLLAHGITYLAADEQGRIWIATDGGGVNYLQGDSLFHFSASDKPEAEEVLCVRSRPDGSIWFGTRGAGVAHYDGARCTWYRTSTGLVNDTVRDVVDNGQGGLWFCTNGGLSRFDGTTFQNYGRDHGLPDPAIRRGLVDAQGHAWFATIDRGYFQLGENAIQYFNEAAGLPSEVMRSLFQDRSGALWIGTSGGGVCRSDAHSFNHWTKESGIPSATIKSMLTEENGDIWFGTYDAGLCRYDGSQFHVLGVDQGLPAAPITGLARDARGRLWCALNGVGVVILHNDGALLLDERNGLPSNLVDDLIADPHGDIWIGTARGAAHVTPDRLTVHTNKTGLAGNPVRKIMAGPSGRVWFSVRGVGLTLSEDDRFTTFTPAQGLSHENVTCMLEDRRGWSWFGTHRGVTVLTQEGKFELHEADGLPHEMVTALTEDAWGNVVFGTRFGMGRVLLGDTLTHWPVEARVETFGYADGFYGIGVNEGQTMARDARGTIWAATNTDLTTYTPTPTPFNEAPVVRLDAIDLFNEPVDWTLHTGSGRERFRLRNGILVHDVRHRGSAPWALLPQSPSLPYNNNFLTFHFTGVQTDRPNTVRFRWMLEGADPAWSAPSATRTVQYGNLDPGSYVFNVQAANGLGSWSKVLSYPFTIRPPWWATWWAYTAYVLIIILSIIGYVRWRLAALKARQRQLEEEVARATREIRQEKEVSEALLLNILPREVADELKVKGEAEARLIEQVTVLFTDFKGFTAMSEQVSPKQLVKDLHECFSHFDRICERYGLEKIKTIGDAYMAAGGLPTPNTTHATDVIHAALAMRDFIAEGKARKIASGLPYFEIRIGIHTGPVVAGIVGVKKFQYDIWGDTVNTASRMESSGEVGQVNISEATYALVTGTVDRAQLSGAGQAEPVEAPANDDQQPTTMAFIFTPRGKVQAKGKGDMEMYFVRRSSEAA
ncbi:MAG: hypothetical protein JNM31_09885 [Flavobacteriales bacterium]|nr:hypothetical protein [Flavobacteriales bacterium]